MDKKIIITANILLRFPISIVSALLGRKQARGYKLAAPSVLVDGVGSLLPESNCLVNTTVDKSEFLAENLREQDGCRTTEWIKIHQGTEENIRTSPVCAKFSSSSINRDGGHHQLPVVYSGLLYAAPPSGGSTDYKIENL